MDARTHWEAMYKRMPITEVGWYQREARTSLKLIRRAAPDPNSAVIDVGGGASTLADGLIGCGYRNITVLDIASAALAAARTRLGSAAATIRCVSADVCSLPFRPLSMDLWHDRAVFHFLTSPEDRRTYVAQVGRAIRSTGHVIIATFAADGPTRCSGLDVCRYDPEDLQRELGSGFELLTQVREEHVTPGGARQRFQYCLFARRHSQS